MREIPLNNSRECATRGIYVALVDDVDYEHFAQHHWSAQRLVNGTAVQIYARRIEYSGGSKRSIWMHRDVWELAYGPIPNGMEIDHVSHGEHKGLDNRRSNLRLATRSLNMANVGVRSTNKSGYKGVWWDEPRRKWQAYIRVNYKRMSLGRYPTAEEAAKAYDLAAREHFGEHARLNLPDAHG